MTKPTDHTPKTSPAAPAKVGSDAVTASPLLPKSWNEIRVGSLVVAQENVAEGWWEAMVTEIRGDVLTLRWQGYPRLPAITRNRKEVGLLFPGN